MTIRIVPPSGSSDDGDSDTENTGPARLGRKGDIDNNEALDTTDYPLVDIHVNADLDETVALDEEDFTVYEADERTEIEEFDFRASSLDLVFVFDDTGSMGGEIAGAKRGITKLTNAVANRSIDAQYGLVSFKDDVEVDQQLTGDASQIKRKIDQLSASGGGDYPEANFDAIQEALDLDLREDAETVFVDITDAISHYRGDGSGYSSYVREEVAANLNDAGVTFVAVAPDTDNEGGILVSDEASRKGSLKRLAGDVGGLWTDIEGEDFDWVLDRIIALLVGTYVITIHTCTPPGEKRRVRVEFDHDRFGSDADTGWMSIPSSKTLPPECVEEKNEVERRGADGIDSRTTQAVSDRDDYGLDEETASNPTETDPSEEEDPIPLAIESNSESVSPGESIEVTVRDPDGRISGATVTASDTIVETSERGIASIKFEEEGEVEVEAIGPLERHDSASKIIEVQSDESSSISERPGNLSISESKPRDSSTELPSLTILPSKNDITAGETIQFTVREQSGNRVEGVTLSTSTGQSAVTDSRGTCELTFDESGKVQVETIDIEGSYEYTSVTIQVR